MRLSIDITALILSAICLNEVDGTPMSAADIAFMLDVTREEADFSLEQLLADGTIGLDGDLYRLKRDLTAFDVARIARLHQQLEEMRPIIDAVPLGLNS
jgi:predicted ArsR family transcriptional regulator